MGEVPIEFQVHAQATLTMYEGMGGVLGSLLFRSTFAWLSFSDEVYQWWGGNVYGGCKTKGCDVDDQNDYKKGLDMANIALISQNGLEAVICLVVLLIMPRVPDAYYVKRVAVLGLSIGTIALVVAVSVESYCKPVAFTGFAVTAFYHTVANVFPFSIVGIMGKELQISAHGFNNNGLYIACLLDI
ncbi:hypothetical protein G195_009389 [Phytophthora kernoviae 00238/432]|uniref:Uncharacterized protein n=1 Tax=Phytophthora kernoviae 00238/432 TaxID=1284355 RepID=A0A8J4S649_9STRA|nr:hypothetical protein G195_009389 [Phytophthora kernoviae 00238/432]